MLAVLLSALALAASDRVVALQTAFGERAEAAVQVSVERPRWIHVRVWAKPRQLAVVTWTVTCTRNGTGASKSGAFFAKTTVTRSVSLPKRLPDVCTASARARLQDGGTIELSLKVRDR